jgi:hypothetical protein
MGATVRVAIALSVAAGARVGGRVAGRPRGRATADAGLERVESRPTRPEDRVVDEVLRDRPDAWMSVLRPALAIDENMRGADAAVREAGRGAVPPAGLAGVARRCLGAASRLADAHQVVRVPTAGRTPGPGRAGVHRIRRRAFRATHAVGLPVGYAERCLGWAKRAPKPGPPRRIRGAGCPASRAAEEIGARRSIGIAIAVSLAPGPGRAEALAVTPFEPAGAILRARATDAGGSRQVRPVAPAGVVIRVRRALHRQIRRHINAGVGRVDAPAARPGVRRPRAG